jgi:hypothetical protein
MKVKCDNSRSDTVNEALSGRLVGLEMSLGRFVGGHFVKALFKYHAANAHCSLFFP